MSKTKKVRKLFKSAKMGNPYAMYKLGIAYQLGKIVSQNMNESAMWIEEAARLGCVPAIEWIKDYSFDDNPYVQAYA